jgi:membrane-associated phospholipid phosphatase
MRQDMDHEAQDIRISEYRLEPCDLGRPLPEDLILVLFFAILASVHIVWRVPFDPDPLTIDRLLLGLSIMLGIMALTALKQTVLIKDHRSRAGLEGAAYTVRAWFPYLMVGVTYQLIQPAVVGLREGTIDVTLMDADRLLFLGNDPVLMIEEVSFPLLTDWFAFCYALYFILPGGMALMLHFRDRRREFRLFMLMMVISFYLGYLGYIFLPAVGPRYTIPDEFQHDLKGILVWDHVKAMYLEMETINRDCFPSLHTAQALIPLFFAYRYKGLVGKERLLFWVLLPIVISICISTVYLRYHWVVDVFAGAVLAAFSIYLGKFLYDRFPWPRDRSKPQDRT